MSVTLLPCPFCGHEAAIDEATTGGYYVFCTDGCGATIGEAVTLHGVELGMFDSREDAAYVWNQRTRISHGAIHGQTCPKKEHTGEGHLHGEDDDSLYNVDGMTYCGRCHALIDY